MYGVGILTVLAVGLCVFYYSSDIKGEKKKDDLLLLLLYQVIKKIQFIVEKCYNK